MRKFWFTLVPYQMASDMLERAGLCCSWLLQSSSLVEELEQLEQRKRAIETRFSMFTAAQPAPTRSSPQGLLTFFHWMFQTVLWTGSGWLALLDPDPYWECRSRSRSKGLRQKAFVSYVLWPISRNPLKVYFSCKNTNFVQRQTRGSGSALVRLPESGIRIEVKSRIRIDPQHWFQNKVR